VLICADIGNSSIGIGYYTDAGLTVQRIDTQPLQDDRVYYRVMSDFMAQNHIEKNNLSCIISSVVINHTAVFIKALESLAGPDRPPLVVSNRMCTGLSFDQVAAPEELGADRIATAAAAYELYRGPVVVVDFGTATTITAVDRRGALIGGTIMPGLGLMNRALGEGTSKLKEVPLDAPGSVLGSDTARSICAGLFFGTAGAVDRIIAEIEEETGAGFGAVITGGYSRMMKNYLKRHYDIRPFLIFEGLRILYDENRP
jgi:type III pantothenate kinase